MGGISNDTRLFTGRNKLLLQDLRGTSVRYIQVTNLASNCYPNIKATGLKHIGDLLLEDSTLTLFKTISIYLNTLEDE